MKKIILSVLLFSLFIFGSILVFRKNQVVQDSLYGKRIKKENSAKKALENDVTMIITADHGNAEWMFNEETNAPQTAHTTNVVPFIVISKDKYEVNDNGALCDIAPSILNILNLEQPKEMTGKSLVEQTITTKN